MKRVIMAAMMIVLMIASMAVPAYAQTASDVKAQYPQRVILQWKNSTGGCEYHVFDVTNADNFYLYPDGGTFQNNGTTIYKVGTTGSLYARVGNLNQRLTFKTTNASKSTVILPWDDSTYVYSSDKTTLSQVISCDTLASGRTLNVIQADVPIRFGDPTEAGSTLIYTPEPEEYNYNVNPGDYVRFTKEGSESWGILVNVVSGNEPYMQIRNYNASGHVNTYFASPLSSISVLTNDHIDIDLKSTRNNEPLVITTSAEMETLSTGGTPPPDGTTNQELTLSTNPDTAIFTNLTGETQYISYWREEIGENQFTQIKVESKVGNYWQVMGATPQIKDVKVRKIPIAANVRYTIFNNNGSTKITYPVIEGFNVQTLTNGVYNPPEWNGNEYGGGIALPDDPSIITDPGSIYPNVPIPERPDDVLGLLNWAADLTLEFITAMGAAVGGMFQFLQKFGTLFGAITFLPAEFTIAFTMLIIVSLALRVVGR